MVTLVKIMGWKIK